MISEIEVEKIIEDRLSEIDQGWNEPIVKVDWTAILPSYIPKPVTKTFSLKENKKRLKEYLSFYQNKNASSTTND